MLVFEKEGFLEVDDSQIEELYQSRTSVTLQTAGAIEFQLRAVLCRHKTAEARASHVVFYCRQLKRAFIYGVPASAGNPATEALTQFVQTLGFELEPVNLNLNPALRQVILKDVGGLLSPAEALRQRSERESSLAELEAIVREGPAESVEVKRAAHKLNAERHLDNQAALLRSALESRMPVPDNKARDSRELVQKIEELSTQLKQALVLAEEERQQREHADIIRMAAEKRLQELESDLVGAETRTAAGLKKVSQLEKKLNKSQKKLSETELALESASAREAKLETVNANLQNEIKGLQSDLKNSAACITAAENGLSAAKEKSARETQAAEKEIAGLKKNCLALEQKVKETTGELEEIRSTHARLVKSSTADKQRIDELEATLAETSKELSGLKTGVGTPDLQKEQRRLETALEQAREAAESEKTARLTAEKELQRSQRMIDDLEETVKSLQKSSGDTRRPDGQPPRDAQAEKLLLEQVRELEDQLEQERREVKSLSNALDQALKKTIDLEARLPASNRPAPPAVQPVIKAESAPPAGRKPLPHETRPASKAGALFHPDWDLSGLPCRSSEQILEAWGSVFNVQLALEGYPSQYCTAFVVIVKEEKLKKLYLLFELKQDKHVLVCVPGKPPRNEAGLKEQVAAARNYLKLSGFEIEKIPAASRDSSLKKYFSPTV